jgi:hypothetical protein
MFFNVETTIFLISDVVSDTNGKNVSANRIGRRRGEIFAVFQGHIAGSKINRRIFSHFQF